jgi:protein-S-isoprenylcysteine O-methyltransferase Ste14
MRVQMDNGKGMTVEMGRMERLVRRIRVPLGFVFAAVFLWRARPSLLSLALSLILVVPGLWLRGYAAGYVKKNAELTQTGPYAYTRNPLYLGSMMAAFGFAFASRQWYLVVLLAVLFAVIYGPVILSEERYLRGHFADFDAYARRVPRLFPRLTAAPAPEQERGSFSRGLYMRHREYNSVMGASALFATMLLLMWVRVRFGAH